MTTNTILPFDYGEHELRVISKDGGLWFAAQDVCQVLGISKHRAAIARLDDFERGSLLVDTLGGPQTITAVNESGLYHLIFKSRKPTAIKFRKWVTGEVLPSIRQTGRFEFSTEDEFAHDDSDSLSAILKQRLENFKIIDKQSLILFRELADYYRELQYATPPILSSDADIASKSFFARITLDADPNRLITCTDLYRNYSQWCWKTNQPIYYTSERTLGKALNSYFPGIRRVRRKIGGRRQIAFPGLQIAPNKNPGTPQ